MPDPPAHSERYDQALLWAAQLHRGQRRKGKPAPAVSHLISVSALVWEDGGREDQAIAALLHDAIEDAGQHHASIEDRSCEAVATARSPAPTPTAP
jgi:(p)ppGpp synthase/HD superfamily hydrolase